MKYGFVFLLVSLFCFTTHAGESVKNAKTNEDIKVPCEESLTLPGMEKTTEITKVESKEIALNTDPEKEKSPDKTTDSQKKSSVWKKRLIIGGIGLVIGAGGTYGVERIIQHYNEKNLRDTNGQHTTESPTEIAPDYGSEPPVIDPTF